MIWLVAATIVDPVFVSGAPQTSEDPHASMPELYAGVVVATVLLDIGWTVEDDERLNAEDKLIMGFVVLDAVAVSEGCVGAVARGGDGADKSNKSLDAADALYCADGVEAESMSPNPPLVLWA